MASTKDGGWHQQKAGMVTIRPLRAHQLQRRRPNRLSSLAKKKALPNAYNLFLKEKIPEIKLKYPDMNHRDLLKEAAKGWKQLTQNTATCGLSGTSLE